MTRNGKHTLKGNLFRRLLWLIILQVSFLVLLTCTSSNRVPGFVHLRIGNNPTTLDPALIVDVNGGSIAAKLFNGLVRLGDDLRVAPDIAERWTVSEDGLTYRFFLKNGVSFSSGREVHAWDFKYSFERVLDPETKSSHTWIFDNIEGSEEFIKGMEDDVKGIRIIDDYTLEIELKRTFSPFLGLLTMPAAYVVPMEEVLHQGLFFSSRPVGTGPFVLEEWLPNRYLKLKGRQDYFEGAPSVIGIMYRIIPEELTAVAEFELGNLDIISIPQSEYSRYRNSPKWGSLISQKEGINTYYLGLNCRKPPFDNPRMRQAVSHSIDRKRILDTLHEGKARLASGPVPDILRTWPQPKVYEYDVKKAIEIVKEENPARKEVDFYIVDQPQVVVDIAEVIQSYVNKAGFDVKLRMLEWSAFKETINNGEADMFWLSWWADYPDPENFLFPTFHSSNHGPGGNRAMYSNMEVDDLVDAGRHASNEELRNDYYEKAERLIVEDAPWVFFWHNTEFILRQPWIKDYKAYPVYSMDKGLDISI